MNTAINSIKVLEARLLNLDEKINNYCKKDLDETIGIVQERILSRDQEIEPISDELRAYTYECSNKFDDLHIKLKNKEIHPDEIPKLKEQLIQLHKTMGSFASHGSTHSQESLHSSKEKLVCALSAQLELLANEILNNYESVPITYQDDPHKAVLHVPCSPLFELSRFFTGDPRPLPAKQSCMEQLKILTPTPIQPFILHPQMKEPLTLVCEWNEKNQGGMGDKAIRSDNFMTLLAYSHEAPNPVLLEQCETFAVKSLMDSVNYQEMTIQGEKWLEYARIFPEINLPKLKQVCIETLPYVKVDLTKPKGKKCLMDIAVLIEKNHLPGFNDKSHYPQVNLAARGGEKIRVNLATFLYFSCTFQNLMEDLNYEYSSKDVLEMSTPPEQIKTFVEWMEERRKTTKQSALINEGNWKDLLQIANFWDVKVLKEQCEEFAVKEINRDNYPEAKYTNEELKDLIVFAKRTDSTRLLDALMGKWKPL